jgi:serine/threonine-protein kinase
MDTIGTGSMGTVYKALSRADNNWYAIKVLPRRSMWNVRIARRKVRVFEQCRHPAVVPFVDVGTAGGMHYLAWPLVEGEALDKIVQREGKLSPARATLYALQTAQGLEVCHSHGLFHGMLKPSNLMIGADGQVRILDLGIGSLLAETEGESLVDTMSSANAMASSLDCASPESIMDSNNLTPSGDQYSLGCILYYCLAGCYPFPDGSAVEKMMAHQTKEPIRITDHNPTIPAELVAVVERLMRKVPEARYPDISEVIKALRPLAGPNSSLDSNRNCLRERLADRHPGPSASPTEQTHPERRLNLPGPALGSLRPVPSSTPLPSGGISPPDPVKVEKPAEGAPLPEAAIPGKNVRKVQPTFRGPSRSLEDRLGPVGLAILAILVCFLAWLASLKLF